MARLASFVFGTKAVDASLCIKTDLGDEPLLLLAQLDMSVVKAALLPRDTRRCVEGKVVKEFLYFKEGVLGSVKVRAGVEILDNVHL